MSQKSPEFFSSYLENQWSKPILKVSFFSPAVSLRGRHRKTGPLPTCGWIKMAAHPDSSQSKDKINMEKNLKKAEVLCLEFSYLWISCMWDKLVINCKEAMNTLKREQIIITWGTRGSHEESSIWIYIKEWVWWEREEAEETLSMPSLYTSILGSLVFSC